MRRLLVGLLMLLAGPARADLKDVTISLTPAYAVAYIDDRTANGGGFAASIGLGLSDTVSLQATSALTWHDAPATKMLPAGSLSAYTAMVGINYTLDAIRLQPAFDVSIGAIGIRGDTSFGSTANAAAVSPPVNAFGVSAAFLLDYLLTRHLWVGVEVRYHAVLTDMSRVPMFLYAGPRVTWRWGK